MTIPNTEALHRHINQNGVRPGTKKLAQFIKACELRGMPKLYEQDGKGDETIAFVKLFDPTGSWTWFLTEFSAVAPDGIPNLAFGLVYGHETELGYVSLEELSQIRGALGLGIEIDVFFLPMTLKEIRAKKGSA